MWNRVRTASAVLITLLLLAATPASAQGGYGGLIFPDQSNELSPADRARLDALRRSQREADERQTAQQIAEVKALREKLLRLPPLPDERNVLLGRWRLEGAGKARGKSDMDQLMGMLTNPGGAACDVMFGSGGTEFTPTTYSSSGVAGLAQGPVAYRGGANKVIVAIPAKNGVRPIPFDVTNPNRIMFGDDCALVRVGAPGAGAATSTIAPSNARVPTASATPQLAAVAPAPPMADPVRPPREVCVNRLLDQLGKVGVAQVRAMSAARFGEAAIEGKEPNTGNLRLDLRGSACDDPRIKASLYDFDAAGRLQSITYVWDRPPGPAPAPIFAERVTTLSRLFPSLPQPHTSGRLQGDTSLGRLVLQDMPERNLLLEAYAAR